MARYFTEADLDPAIIRNLRVAMMGYGNQGRSHALNLRDSGVGVVVGVREGKSADQAKEEGFAVLSVRQAVVSSDLVRVAPEVVITQCQILPDGKVTRIKL